METVNTPDGEPFALKFTPGLPMGAGPWIFLAKDGSIHAGEIMRVKNALSPTGESQVLRTTNPTGGKHDIFDISVSKLAGYAFAGQQYPFASELGSAY
jgi:hypothetical protein